MPILSLEARAPAQRQRRRSSLACRGAASGSCVLLLLLFAACAGTQRLPGGTPAGAGRELVVSASAYNSVPEQTDSQPTRAAWGDTLRPGMKVIAVSADLLELGLRRGTRVRIDGLPGEYLVLDRMARRWRRKIDLYMGQDVAAARSWGVKTVTIRWHDPAQAAGD